jgi:cytochrome c oxidase cbb3-type subunit 4
MDMDVNTLRVAVTVAGLVLFLLLVAHSYSRKRSTEHQEAAMLPFLEENQENTRE